MEPNRGQVPHRGRAIAVLVVAGLASSIAAEVWLIDPPAGDLPGAALRSGVILAVERIVLLFAAWLLVAIVVVRALSGELPVEISGRGVRFADAAIAQHGVVTSEATFERIDDEVRALQEAVAVLETGQDQRAEQRRYAMKDGHDDH